MDHHYETCDGACLDTKGDYCLICRAGLATCRVCRCAEGTLASECPGEPVHPDDQDRIFAAELDYKDGRWYKPPTCRYCGHGYVRRCMCAAALAAREAAR